MAADTTDGYIWHRDPFALSVVVPLEADGEPHLRGEQTFGENTADEWVVCFLLFEISKAFAG